MKRDLDLSFYYRVEHGSPISGWFIALIHDKLIPFIFICKCIDIYVEFMDDIFMIFMFLLCWFYVCFMTKTMCGSQHVFTCT